jgi:hypothetical protein
MVPVPHSKKFRFLRFRFHNTAHHQEVTNLGALHELLVEGGEHMLHGPLQVTQLHLEYSLKSHRPVDFNIEMCLFLQRTYII